MPRPRQKLGYNWKARQPKGGASFKRKRDNVSCGDVQADQLGQFGGESEGDTNVFALPEKKAKLDPLETKSVKKRKKLSSKERKRLQKIVEAKERKAKVNTDLPLYLERALHVEHQSCGQEGLVTTQCRTSFARVSSGSNTNAVTFHSLLEGKERHLCL